MMGRGERRIAFGLSLVFIAVVGAFAKLPETLLPIGSDTGMFATYAREMLQGAQPYVAFYDVHPPLTHYYWVLVEAVAGTDWSRTCLGSPAGLLPQPCVGLLAHGFDLVLTFVTAGLVYAIARRLELRPLVGGFAALLVVWFANESMISQEGSTPTKLTLVPCTLAVYAFVRALQARRPLGWSVVAGAAAALGVMTKQPALVTLLAIATYTAGSCRPRAGERRVCWSLPFGLAVGVLGVLAVICGYLALIGSLGGFVDQAWGYNVTRIVIGYWQTPAGLTSPATRIDRVFGEAAGLLFVGALLGGLSLAFGPSRPPQRFLLVWGIWSLAAIAGFREFAQVVPALALLAALGIGRLWDAAGRDGLGLGTPVVGRLALLAIFGTVFVLTSSFQVTQFRRMLYERGPSAKPADPELIAGYLRTTAPAGPIFAWANAGQIYALSGRQPATHFVIAELTDGISPRVTPSRQQVMDDLQAHPAAAIVVDPAGYNEPSLKLSQFVALNQLIQACYQPVSNMPANWGVYVRTASCSSQ